MNFKALLALALAVGAGGPAGGQDYGASPYAPKPATPYGAQNAYSPYGPRSSTDLYGTTNLNNPYDTSSPSGDRSGAYGAGAASTNVPEYGASNPYSPNPYDKSAPAAQQSSAYGGASTVHDLVYGSNAGSGGDPYAPARDTNPVAPKSDADVDHSAGLLGEDATKSWKRNDGLSEGSDESLQDPLAATQSDPSAGSGPARDPYGLSIRSMPKLKIPQPAGGTGILGFDPFDPKSLLAPTRQSATPARSAAKNDLLGTGTSSAASASGQASSLAPISPSLGATVPGAAAR
jgi:hypothetical protein